MPLSMRLMSRMSLIRDRRNRPETSSLARQSAAAAGSSSCWNARVAMPRMAFMGVRISWLIRERNSLLAALACSAWARAVRRMAFWRSCCWNRPLMSERVKMMVVWVSSR